MLSTRQTICTVIVCALLGVTALGQTVTNWIDNDDNSCTTTYTGGKIPEALYVKDLEVATGTTLDADNLGIYYTGTLTNNGTIENGSAIELTPTTYGDFNGDGDEPADVDRFNDAFPSEIDDDEYDPLVDWDCDGDADCDDRSQYILNWNPTGIEDDNCG